MSEVKIKAESRNEFGKGAARRIRRSGLVPAVLYGHGNPPVHITLPGHELMMALKTPNALFDVEVEGKSDLALPKQVQRDPIKGFIEHVDLVVVRRGEKVVVEIAVHAIGEPDPDTLMTYEHAEVSVEAEATHIPEGIEINVDGVEAGTQLLAQDLPLPSGVTLQTDPETLVINITAAQTAAQFEAELAEAEEEAGVEHEPSDSAEGEVPSGSGEGESGSNEE